MFTGIVQAVGRTVSVRPFVVDAGGLSLRDVRIGDSICVQGVCLTVTAKRGRRLSFDVSRETRAVTTGLEGPGEVNLEKSLAVGERLGGHFVTGHVDGVGRVLAVENGVVRIRAPGALARYIARKGSIAVDGVSLTVNRVSGADFEVFLIPHTLRETTLRRLAPGARVNLEVDPVARYVERILSASGKVR
jgi:riboflavin synthase